MLGIWRVFLGIGEAGNYPASVKLIAEWFPVRERSLAAGIFNSGASIGAILAPPLLAWIALSFGIRAAFLIVGLSGFLWLAAWLTFYKLPQQNPMDRPIPVATSQLLRSKFLWQFTFSKVFSDPVWYFYTFWFPQYLRTEFQFTLRQIGATAWIPFFTAAVGNIAGGLLFVPLSRCSGSPQTARRLSVLILSTLMMSALCIPVITTRTISIELFVSLATGYSGHWRTCLRCRRCISHDVASVWFCGAQASEDVVRPHHRLDCAALLVRPGVRPIRYLAGDFSCADLGIAEGRRLHLFFGLARDRELDDAHGHSAIDYQVFASNEVVLRQHDDSIGNVFGLSFAVEGNSVLQIICYLFRAKVLLKGGPDHSRRDAIDADIAVGKLSGQGTSELRQGAFHHAISERSEAAAQTRRGAKQDDRAASRFGHMRSGSACEEEDGVNMDSECAHPDVFRDLLERSGRRPSRGIDKYIETAEVLHCLLNASFAGARVGDVNLNRPKGRFGPAEGRGRHPLGPEREARTTDAPFAAKAIAVAAPIPLVPPVMRQTLPARSIFEHASLVLGFRSIDISEA
jgi:hypothetical protein